MNTIPPTIIDRIETKLLDTMLKAQEVYGTTMEIPTIKYETMGVKAGRANYLKWTITLNPAFFDKNLEDMIENTLPHEVAHLVVEKVYPQAHRAFGNRRIHGKEWKAVMFNLGVKAERCHHYNTTDIKRARNTTYYIYKCNCMEHKVSTTLHNRILRGRKYLCKKCKKSITMVV